MHEPIGKRFIEPGTEVTLEEAILGPVISCGGGPKSVILVLRDDQSRYGIATEPNGQLGRIAFLRDRGIGEGDHIDLPIDKEPERRLTVTAIRRLASRSSGSKRP